MGQVTVKMAEAAREAGAEIRTGVGVQSILTQGSGENVSVTGVALDDGATVSSDMVLSGADPKHTFETLCDPADLPATSSAPCATSARTGPASRSTWPSTGSRAAAVSPGRDLGRTTGVLELGPTLDVLDLQQAEARAGIAATGAHIEMCFPTVHDPSLAPEGKHVATIDINSQPYTLAER